MEDQWVKQQQINELLTWKQNEHLELLSQTQMHKLVYHWQDLFKKKEKQKSRAIFINNKLLQE